MSNNIKRMFEDDRLIEIIKSRLPHLFHLAEMESSRAGKIGMEVGSLRERIIIALLIYKFGEANVEIQIPITKSEVDVEVFGQPISIKTITGRGFGGVKLIWTVDAQKAREFRENYYPHCDILLVKINWDNVGGFYYIPLEAQKRLFDIVGREKYIKLPKQGTNPRGVEFAKDALSNLVGDDLSKVVEIYWHRSKIDYNPYKRWIDYWRKD